MAMSKFHEMMLPVLKALDGSEMLTSAELQQEMVKVFSLSEEEQSERLSSGQIRYYNRMYWAITDLHKAGFLQYGKKKGTYLITQEGREFLKHHNEPFTTKELMQESNAFREWKEGYQAKEKEKHDAEPSGDESASPQELTQDAAQELRDALASDLLQAIMEQSPWFFEYLVGKLLQAMGYGESVDNPVHVTPPNLETRALTVSSRKTVWALTASTTRRRGGTLRRRSVARSCSPSSAPFEERAPMKGLFITTAGFSQAAREYVEKLNSQKLVLVDGNALASLMIDYGAGVSTVATFEVKSIDTDFFTGE